MTSHWRSSSTSSSDPSTARCRCSPPRFHLTQSAIIGLNLLNVVQALRILDGSAHVGAFGGDQTDTLALLSLDAHRYGYVLGLTCFGVATVLVGLLVRAMRRSPRPLPWLLVLAGIGYVVDTAMFVLVPRYDGSASPIVLAPAFVAEIWFCGWLITKGRSLEAAEDAAIPTAPSVAPAVATA